MVIAKSAISQVSHGAWNHRGKSWAFTLTRLSISWVKAVNRRCTRSPSGIKCACRPSPQNDEPQRAKARNFLMGKVPHVCGMGARSHQEKSRSPCQNISSSAAFGTARTDKKTMGLRQNCSDLFCERERASWQAGNTHGRALPLSI